MLGLAVLFTGMAAYFLVLALYLQDGRGLGALASGAVFTAVAVPYMVGSGSAAALLGRYGARTAIAAAALVFGAGHGLLLLAVAEVGVGGSVLWLLPGLVVGGVGMGVALSGLVGVVMGSVEPRHAGTVSGTSSTVQQLGNAVGVALVGIVFFGRLDHGMVDAFEASLVYLVATTVAVAGGRGVPARPGAAGGSAADGARQLVGRCVGVLGAGHDGLGQRVEVVTRLPSPARPPSARAERRSRSPRSRRGPGGYAASRARRSPPARRGAGRARRPARRGRGRTGRR